MVGGQKRQAPTPQERAIELRQSKELDQEIRKSEKRFKSMTRNTLGSKSLMDGLAKRKQGPL